MPWLDIEGTPLFYTDSGQGVPIVFIHGWGCDSNDWVFQLAQFEGTFRVIAADLPGHGFSQAGHHVLSVAGYAQAIATFIQSLELRSVVVVGHSMGGLIATTLAVEYPDLVRAGINVDPSYGTSDGTRAIVADLIPRLGTVQGNTEAADSIAELEPAAPAWLRTWHRRRLLGTAPTALRQSFENLYFGEGQVALREQSEPYLQRRRSPTLSFHSGAAKAAWEKARSTHPDDAVVEWSDAGHWMHQERPEEFNRIALDWLGRVLQ